MQATMHRTIWWAPADARHGWPAQLVDTTCLDMATPHCEAVVGIEHGTQAGRCSTVVQAYLRAFSTRSGVSGWELPTDVWLPSRTPQ